jgi:predicted amidohydrolase YtcJ
MTRAPFRLLAVLLLAAAAVPVGAASEPADLLLLNGAVYTVNDKQPRAEAVAVRGGKILFVGSNAEGRRLSGPATRVVDLRGATVVPGLADAHAHLAGIGRREMTLNLEGTESLEALLRRVKERVDLARPGAWVTGRGWIETFWTPAAFPSRRDLDRVAPNTPVYLVRADGHGAVVNSRALEIAGIAKGTESPFGGEIMRDSNGEPNGMLLDNAQALVTKHVPEPTEEDRIRALEVGARREVELGWTQVQNAGSTFAETELLRRLFREGRVKLRVYNAIYGPGDEAMRLARQGASIGELDHRLTVRAIKVSFDGALGSKGAALIEPYADHDTSGFLKYKEDELMPMFVEALRNGIQIETHAIGDRANRVILDLYEKAFRAVPPERRAVREPRWRVEHAQIVKPEDIKRFAALGVIPSMQPSHAIGDLHFAPSRIGIERLAGAYAWKSMLASGSIVAGGSDAPVERGEPMIEFYAAVARRDLKGFSGPGWHPEERVGRDAALKMFTIWAAHAAFEEGLRGTIEPGKLADLTVLSADIMRIPEAEIPKTRCLMTVIGGEVVFDALEPRRAP